jgi:hypothetical protein
MRFYSDVVSGDAIEQDELWGTPLVEGDAIFIPQAHGTNRGGKPNLWATLDRYTMRQINGHTVLLRGDALRALERENALYDYGVLVKVAREADFLTDLKNAEHKSIKVLYANPEKPWRDPFVHGPNER